MDNPLAKFDADDAAGEWAEVIALYTTIVPVLGDVVSHVVSGWTSERKRARIREVFLDLYERLRMLRAQLNEHYVGTDDFEDLLDQTLRRVAFERHEAKRRLYREVLVGAATGKGSYDHNLRLMRAVEQMQPAHFLILRALPATG